MEWSSVREWLTRSGRNAQNVAPISPGEVTWMPPTIKSHCKITFSGEHWTSFSCTINADTDEAMAEPWAEFIEWLGDVNQKQPFLMHTSDGKMNYIRKEAICFVNLYRSNG